MSKYKVVNELDANDCTEFEADNDFEALKKALGLTDSYVVRSPEDTDGTFREIRL